MVSDLPLCYFPDSGSHDEGIHIPKGRGIHSNLAKSLPVNVPAFLPQDKKLSDDRYDERVSDFPGLKLILRWVFVVTCGYFLYPAMLPCI